MYSKSSFPFHLVYSMTTYRNPKDQIENHGDLKKKTYLVNNFFMVHFIEKKCM